MLRNESPWHPFRMAAILAFCCLVLIQFSSVSAKVKAAASAMKITSAAFQEGQRIPTEFTEDGKNTSPPLSVAGVPDNCKSLALICDDPDAPVGTWTHWVIYNIPINVKELNTAVAKTQQLPNGATQGKNSGGSIGYDGPAPPPGKTHRYFFKLYALDDRIEGNAPLNKEQLLSAMKGHVLAESQLIGTYSR